MNSTMTALRPGFRRGMIELRQTFTNGQDLFGQFFWPAIMIVVMLFLRDNQFEGVPLNVASFALPSVLGMNIGFTGLTYLAQLLTVEREDGTLLRAKAVPNGMSGYLIGKIVTVSGITLIGVLIILIPGVILFDGLALNSVGSWLTFAWVTLLGLVATLPIGAVIGSLMKSPRSLGLIMLPLMGLVGVSGIFFPLSSLPEWLQIVAQILPIYWLGLGMRSAMLPDQAVMIEIGESWRHLETLGVLGVWAIVGLTLAPMVLRRMARRESGSSVAARREKALQRVG
ncbi:ABC transporter [Amycolatopsis antarctica]|uniref:ABC transporter n=1 Tax=Amycolatopsis antarctica TaxID=1854586 RepID=A0A263D321_9PSEU|nr:ABC transporter permease [Amycolatopsis antarctica]OZM71866.1 ABC transporter [Amycolatopsis antarctica]